MFNLLVALITGIFLGWNFHSFYLQLTPPKILNNEINITAISQVEKSTSPVITKSETIEKTAETITPALTQKIPPKENNTSNISKKVLIGENFYTLLKNNLFSDAMTLYVDSKEPQLSLYHATLVEYFEEKIKTNPQVAMEQMLELHELHELEPSSNKVNEEQFHNIEYNENYLEQATLLLNLMKKHTQDKNEYAHQIILKKVGEHFTVDVEVDNSPITLLLDTGASLTMINREKISALTTIKENITLNTAGGKINANLKEANSFNMGEVQLEKFEIVSSTFEQNVADGLLGMNFFKKFKFKIDQEEAILYLSPLEQSPKKE